MRTVFASMCLLLAATATIVGACSESGTTVSSPPNGEVRDAGEDQATLGGDCPPPSVEAPAWLESFLSEQMAKLTGDIEASPSVTLKERGSVAGRLAARTYLETQLRALGIETKIEEYVGPRDAGANVVGRLPPTVPPKGSAEDVEWVLVGAHYDSAEGTPGANDNASGVAAVLAIAKIITAEQQCRQRGVMFVLFDQEEVGLLGSIAFAKAQAAAKVRIVAAHTIDQVGYDADGDRAFEIEQPSGALFGEYEAAAAVVGAKVVKTETGGTDHQPLRNLGFPAAGVTEEYVNGDTSPHRHEATDTSMTIDRAYQALAVRLVSVVVGRELNAK